MNLLSDFINTITNTVLASPWGAVPFAIALVCLLVYMIFWLRRNENRNKYAATIKWILLEIRVDELNEKSPLAMEQVFAAMHAINQGFTWGEDFAGKTVLNMSCEIVSIGGKVSFIVRLPERFRQLFESAVFAQYPKAEINETEDYLRNMPHHYDPDHVDFDFWGTQWNKKKDNAYPIRTYAQDSSYEHGAQETFIDPLANLLEVMSNMQPYEMCAFQLVLKPVSDDWKDHTKHLLDELKGVPHKHSDDPIIKILNFIPDMVAKFLVDIVSGPQDAAHKAAPPKDPPETLMIHKTDVEKMVINAIEHASSKISYEVRMRTMYLAPKDKINFSMRIPEIVGSLRNFDDVVLNGFKPDIGHSWTAGPAFKVSERLERPYIQMSQLTRKRHFLHNFVPRSAWRGSGKVIMNTEELATIFHFPQVPHSRVSQLERVHTVKSAPPMDLPIG